MATEWNGAKVVQQGKMMEMMSLELIARCLRVKGHVYECKEGSVNVRGYGIKWNKISCLAGAERYAKKFSTKSRF